MPKTEGKPKPEIRRSNLLASVRISDFELRSSRAAGRAFAAQRLGRACRAIAKRRRINVTFDEEFGLPADLSAGTLAKAEASAQAGVGQSGFQVRAKCFQGSANSAKQIQVLTHFRGTRLPKSSSSAVERFVVSLVGEILQAVVARTFTFAGAIRNHTAGLADDFAPSLVCFLHESSTAGRLVEKNDFVSASERTAEADAYFIQVDFKHAAESAMQGVSQ